MFIQKHQTLQRIFGPIFLKSNTYTQFCIELIEWLVYFISTALESSNWICTCANVSFWITMKESSIDPFTVTAFGDSVFSCIHNDKHSIDSIWGKTHVKIELLLWNRKLAKLLLSLIFTENAKRNRYYLDHEWQLSNWFAKIICIKFFSHFLLQFDVNKM